jgi:hypothetical protein
VSPFVAVLMLITGLTVVLALLVVRRRHHAWVTVAVGLVALLVLTAGAVFAIVPPRVTSPSGLAEQCPYDRLVWSNMPGDVSDGWQPCRRTARVELAVILLTASGVTVAAAATGLRLSSPTEGDRLDHATSSTVSPVAASTGLEPSRR